MNIRAGFWLVLAVLFLGISMESPACADQPAAAWWYGAQFKPDKQAIYGRSVTAIDKNWKLAKVLQISDLKGIIAEEERKFKASPLKFEQSFDVNGNGISEVISVGVYQAADGSEGRFLAIRENGKLKKVLVSGGKAGFSAVLIHEGEVRWYFCMECGEYETLVWSGSGYFLE